MKRFLGNVPALGDIAIPTHSPVIEGEPVRGRSGELAAPGTGHDRRQAVAAAHGVGVKSDAVKISKLHPAMEPVIAAVAKAAATLGLPKPVITSGNDSSHKQGSLHFKDRALDFRGNNIKIAAGQDACGRGRPASSARIMTRSSKPSPTRQQPPPRRVRSGLSGRPASASAPAADRLRVPHRQGAPCPATPFSLSLQAESVLPTRRLPVRSRQAWRSAGVTACFWPDCMSQTIGFQRGGPGWRLQTKAGRLYWGGD